MHDLRARKRLGVEHGGLLQLQRRLGGDRQGRAAADDIGRRAVAKTGSAASQSRASVGRERVRQARHGLAQHRVVAPFGDERGQRHRRGDAALGRGDAALGPGVERHHGIGARGERRAAWLTTAIEKAPASRAAACRATMSGLWPDWDTETTTALVSFSGAS